MPGPPAAAGHPETEAWVHEDRSDNRPSGRYDEAYDEAVISEVIRPAAVVPEECGRAILVELSLNSAQGEGLWIAEPSRWNRYDRPWTEPNAPGESHLIGTIQVAYGTPTRYEITIYRVTITRLGSAVGWTVQSLCDEALGYGDLSLANCPRAQLAAAPPPYPGAARTGLLRRRAGQ